MQIAKVTANGEIRQRLLKWYPKPVFTDQQGELLRSRGRLVLRDTGDRLPEAKTRTQTAGERIGDIR
jgi:hypothetical protein